MGSASTSSCPACNLMDPENSPSRDPKPSRHHLHRAWLQFFIRGCSSPLLLDFFQSPNRPSIFVASRKNNINSGAFPSNSSSEKLIISTGAAFNQHQSLCARGRRVLLPPPPAAVGSWRQGGHGRRCPWDGNCEPGEQNHPGGPDSCANTPGLTAPVSDAQGGWSDGAAQMLRTAPTPTQKSQGVHRVGSRNIVLETGLCAPRPALRTAEPGSPWQPPCLSCAPGGQDAWMPCGCSCLPCASLLPCASSLQVFGPFPELWQGWQRWFGGRSPARHCGSLGWLVEQEENKTKCHLEKFLLLHPWGMERLPQDKD